MFWAALKVIGLSYELFLIALVITTGAWALACHHLVFRLILRMWRAWRRSRKGEVAALGTAPKAAPHTAIRNETT
jgi:hypothetical protein